MEEVGEPGGGSPQRREIERSERTWAIRGSELSKPAGDSRRRNAKRETERQPKDVVCACLRESRALLRLSERVQRCRVSVVGCVLVFCGGCRLCVSQSKLSPLEHGVSSQCPCVALVWDRELALWRYLCLWFLGGVERRASRLGSWLLKNALFGQRPRYVVGGKGNGGVCGGRECHWLSCRLTGAAEKNDKISYFQGSCSLQVLTETRQDAQLQRVTAECKRRAVREWQEPPTRPSDRAILALFPDRERATQ